MKEFYTNKKTLILIITGLIATIFSFVYFFVFKNPSYLIFLIICCLDCFLLIINAYELADYICTKKRFTFLFAILIIIIFLGVIQLISLILFENSFNLNLSLKTLTISIFLSPSILILLPIIYFILEALS